MARKDQNADQSAPANAATPAAPPAPAAPQESQDRPPLPPATLAQLKKLPVEELRAICRDKNLPAGGGAEELLKLATVALFGVTDQYIPGMTRCNASGCFHGVRVTGTHFVDTEDGLRITTRSVQCTGPDAHTWPLRESRRLTAQELAHLQKSGGR